MTYAQKPRIIIAIWLLFVLVLEGFPQQGTAETSIRNATGTDLFYALKQHHSAPDQPEIKLTPGQINKYAQNRSLYITFLRGTKRITYRLDPGLPYVFRHDEQGRLELFDSSHGREDALDLATYVKSPFEVVEKMLYLAEVTSQDLVYDLGCGDGRIVIAAAVQYGARGVGIDIVPKRILEAQAAALTAKVAGKVEFLAADIFTVDFSPATVVTLYLIPDSNRLLRPLLERQLHKGTRVVSHGYPIPGWEQRLLKIEEYESELEGKHYIYLYRK